MAAKKKRASSGASWISRGRKRLKPTSMTFTTGKVFVAMSYADSPTKSRIYKAIVQACEKAHLSPNRVDESPGSGNILLEVIDGIEEGEFLVFDLSKGRPNVYYELGYAHGVGNRPEDIILIAKKGTRIHFDIMSFRILYYTSAPDLERKLTLLLKKLVPLARKT
jgi:hypothetical protein